MSVGWWMMFDGWWLREVGCLMAEGWFSFPHTILLTSCIILLTCLLQQIVIQFYDSITEGEAFSLYCFAYFAHDGRCYLSSRLGSSLTFSRGCSRSEKSTSSLFSHLPASLRTRFTVCLILPSTGSQVRINSSMVEIFDLRTSDSSLVSSNT